MPLRFRFRVCLPFIEMKACSEMWIQLADWYWPVVLVPAAQLQMWHHPGENRRISGSLLLVVCPLSTSAEYFVQLVFLLSVWKIITSLFPFPMESFLCRVKLVKTVFSFAALLSPDISCRDVTVCMDTYIHVYHMFWTHYTLRISHPQVKMPHPLLSPSLTCPSFPWGEAHMHAFQQMEKTFPDCLCWRYNYHSSYGC